MNRHRRRIRLILLWLVPLLLPSHGVEGDAASLWDSNKDKITQQRRRYLQMTDEAATTVEEKEDPNEVCLPEECQLCTDTDKDNIPECYDTGRVQTVLCKTQGMKA